MSYQKQTVIPCPQGVTPEQMVARRDAIASHLKSKKVFTKDHLIANSREVFRYIINIKNQDGIDLTHEFGTEFAKQIVNDIMSYLLLGAYSI